MTYVKGDPAFLRRMKEAVGYREPQADLDAKRADLAQAAAAAAGAAGADDGAEERDDERPVVVALRQGDLTPEEARREWDREKERDREQDGEGRNTLENSVLYHRHQFLEDIQYKLFCSNKHYSRFYVRYSCRSHCTNLFCSFQTKLLRPMAKFSLRSPPRGRRAKRTLRGRLIRNPRKWVEMPKGIRRTRRRSPPPRASCLSTKTRRTKKTSEETIRTASKNIPSVKKPYSA